MMRRYDVVVLVGMLTAACNTAPSTRTVSAAELAALPRASVVEGAQVCVSDGRTSCPLRSAYANWVDDSRYVIWEAGKQVDLRGGKDTAAMPIGALGRGTGQYLSPIAAGWFGGKFIVIDGAQSSMLQYDADGKYSGSHGMPAVTAGRSIGFAGAILVNQSPTKVDSGKPVELEVRRLSAVDDTTGTLLLRQTVAWLKLNRDGTPLHAPSYFPVYPVYTILPNGDVAASNGDPFVVDVYGSGQKLKWSTSMATPPLPISDSDIAEARRPYQRGADSSKAISDYLDSMKVATQKNFAAITGIMASRTGQLLVAGNEGSSRDSLDFYVLDKTGKPTRTFRLDHRVKVLLFADDSMLVHEPTGGEVWQVRWLKLH